VGRRLLAAAALAAGVFGAAAASAQEPAGAPAPDFGVPPSGEIPIIFNDHHVYARPDHLKQGRVLTAIVRHDTILVPLRSMFEQTGASVSYDASTKTVDVSKPGADVKVTVGKAWVVVNGQERPLDVPPEIYRGAVVVPLRVLSEGMGAYVQWVPDKHLVAIRYVETIPAAPPATPGPTPRPTVVPSAPAAARPTAAPARTFEHYVAGDYIVAPKVYNELSPGNTGKKSYAVKGAVEFPLFGPTWEVSANYRHFLYPHDANAGVAGCTAGTLDCNTVVGSDPTYQRGRCPGTGPQADPGCVTTVGYNNVSALNGLGQVYVTAFTAQEDDVDAHFALKVLEPRIYVGIGGLFRKYNYLGYPTLGGIGFGIEKLPDLDQPFSVYGSAFYYPNVSGTYTYPSSRFLGSLSGSQITLAYSEWKYEFGGTVGLGKNAFFDFGYLGEKLNAKANAPTGVTINAPYVGLGLHF
jgi:hypothetical protein